MKKLTLKVRELMNPKVLTREQLKNVMGGDGTVTTFLKPGFCTCKINETNTVLGDIEVLNVDALDTITQCVKVYPTSTVAACSEFVD
jgi:hypothetical protein